MPCRTTILAAAMLLLMATFPACSRKFINMGSPPPAISLSIAPSNAIDAEPGLIAAIWPDGEMVFAPGDSHLIDDLRVARLSAADLQALRDSPHWRRLCRTTPTNDFPPDAEHYVLRLHCDPQSGATHRFWPPTVHAGGTTARESIAALSDQLLQLRPAAGDPLADHSYLRRSVEAHFYRPDLYAN